MPNYIFKTTLTTINYNTQISFYNSCYNSNITTTIKKLITSKHVTINYKKQNLFIIVFSTQIFIFACSKQI